MLIVAVIILLMTSGGSDEFDKAYLASLKGDNEAAIVHYTRALEAGDLSKRNRARALNNRAVAYDRQGLYASALTDYQEASTMAPDDLEILRNRSETLRRAELTRADPFGRNLIQVSTATSTDVAVTLRVKEKVKILGIL